MRPLPVTPGFFMLTGRFREGNQALIGQLRSLTTLG